MMKHIRSAMSLKTDRRGVTAVEYGIMAALIATALVAAVGTFSTGLKGAFTNLSTLMGTAPTTK